MGYVAGARSILRSSSSVRNAAARVASKPQLKSSPPCPFSSTRKPLSHSFLRRPVGMIFALESAMPYHSATASALMTSMLSVSLRGYAWLPDDLEISLVNGGYDTSSSIYLVHHSLS